ncbi:MAG: hypothetical protein AAF514_09670, partial [Verrucomicrobiota bacterium]
MRLLVPSLCTILGFALGALVFCKREPEIKLIPRAPFGTPSLLSKALTSETSSQDTGETGTA